MKKWLVLILVFLLALGSLAGYLILNRLIIEGSVKVVAGQAQIKQGQQKLAKGKARLASGERELRNGNEVYGIAEKGPLLAVASIFPATLAVVAGSEVMGKKIAEGNREVAEGRKKVQKGEQQLAAGKLELQHGIQRLKEAQLIRTACGAGTLIFSTLFLFLVYYWRPFKRKKS